ncbi:MAG: PKD domain-containing protein, partial [Phaeodactylibacter sp.]|nr:PKD domain-containing protein [Phaeodactylibacter sp.]
MKTSLALTLCALFGLSFYWLHSEPALENTDAFCTQAQLHARKMQTDDAYRRTTQRMEERLLSLAQQSDAARSPLTQYTLPVVVHIIHNNGGENISDGQVAEALQHLNDAFANVGYYNPATGVDTEIAFCLARRDPDGNATTGVNRIQSTLTGLNSSIDDQAMKNLSRWDPLQYINVWVVKEICSNNGCGVAGYAYLPGAHGQPYDGIVLEAGYMGSNPTGSTVLIHEMGHYLGLYHTFEGGCPNGDCQQEGDRVCDTPPDNTTARTPCSADMNSCDTDEDDTSLNNPFRPVAQGGLGDQVDQKENYMDYSRFECYDRFSQGQKQRMLSVAETIRSSLLDSPACIDPCPAPIAVGFTASAASVPIGSTVNFTNTSANADNYEWTVDGTPFGTTADASYTFNTEGSFEVTLTAFSNLNNCLPADFTITIEVFCPVEASFTGGDTTVLAGASVTFTNTSANATAYTWLVNGTDVSNSADFTLSTTEPGLYNVCLRTEGVLCESLSCGFVEATSPNTGCGDAFFYNLGDANISETATCLIPAADGGFYLGGSRAGQALLMKFDGQGEIIWQRAFSLSNAEEQIHALMEDEQYLVGSVRKQEEISQAEDYQYCFKYNTNTESFEWIRSITNSESTSNRTHEFINIEGSPNYIIVGHMVRPGTGLNCDLIFGELDKNTGNLIQLQKYRTSVCATGYDATLVNGKVYVTGRYNAGNGAYSMRPAITEFEPDGTENWTRLYLVSSNYNPDTTFRLYSISILEDNGALIVGGHGDLNGTSITDVSCYIYKTAIDGAIEWATIIDIPGGDTERIRAVLDQGDGYLAVGYYNPSDAPGADLFLVKIDKSGNLMWAKTLDNDIRDVMLIRGAFARDGYAYISATSYNEGDGNILLFRVNPSGELDTECGSLEPLEVESWQLSDPFDGFFDLNASLFSPGNSAEQILPENVDVPVDYSCSTPCEEICINGQDDDGDGLVDCEDDDCPCFVDCGNTFIQALGQPQVDESLETILLASDGFLYAGGSIGNQGLLVKMTTEGDVIWQRQFDFTNRDDGIVDLIEDDEGFIIGTGYGQGTNVRSAFAFRFDPGTATMQWANTFSNMADTRNINVNPASGNYLIPGSSTGATQDAIIVELDRNTGALVWSKRFDIGTSDTFHGIAPVGDVIYMPTRYTVFNGTGNMRVGITALDNNGNEQWSKIYLTPPGTTARQYGFEMKQDDGALITAYSGHPNGTPISGFKSGLMRTDYAGNLEWATEYDVAGISGEPVGYAMAVTPDGYLLYGYGIQGDEDLMIIKTDKAGNGLWARTYGGAGDEDFTLVVGNPIFEHNGFIYIVGRTNSFNASTDAFLIKAFAADGAVADDCLYSEFRSVSTTFLPNPYEAAQATTQTDFNGALDQLSTPAGAEVALESITLCQSSPADITTTLDSAYCNGDSLAVALRLCNEGTDTLSAGLPFTFYDGNPTADAAATVLAGGLTLPEDILPGECYSATVSVPYPQGQIYCIANDDGSLPPIFNLQTDFPPTELVECDYTNNIDSVTYQTTTPEVNLGPDTSVCENGVFLLDAGPGFAAYRWQDGAIGQTYTTFETGTFWVEATTACGDVARDTIHILLDPVIAIALRPDTTLCVGDSIRFSMPQDPTYTYQWAPGATLDCADCPNVMARPNATTTYMLVVSNTTGCVSVDSVTITVEDCIATLDTAICLGDSLLIEGQVLYPNEMDTVQLSGDSILVVDVSPLDTFYMGMELGACPGETAEYNGVFLQPGQTESFLFTAANGCDSTVAVTARELATFSTNLDTAVCRGQSIDYNGTLLQPGQSETFQLTAANGCDSTVLVTVSPLDTFYLAIGLSACTGETVDYGGTTLQPGQSEVFNFATANGCDSTVEVTVLQLDTVLTTIDTTACEGQSIDYNGTPVPAGQSAPFTFTAAN